MRRYVRRGAGPSARACARVTVVRNVFQGGAARDGEVLHHRGSHHRRHRVTSTYQVRRRRGKISRALRVKESTGKGRKEEKEEGEEEEEEEAQVL